MATAPTPIQKTQPVQFCIQLYHKYSDVTDLKVTVDTFDGKTVLMKASKVPVPGYNQKYIQKFDEKNLLVFFYIPHEEVSAMPEDTYFVRVEYSATDMAQPNNTFYFNERTPFIKLTA